MSATAHADQICDLLAEHEKPLNSSDPAAAAAGYAPDGVFYPFLELGHTQD
jgi:hypothetical protein